jgi:Tfp pilus assembly protein PilV
MSPPFASRIGVQRGFTLLEALIALLVTAFGLLAIAGMQSTLSRNSDIAKQRSEAVRLAQAKMEELRGFDGVLAASGVAFSYATGVVDSGTPETLGAGSNATFTRSWTVRRADGVTPATADDLEKWVTVTVAWTDRTGEAQRVTMTSVIARNDPLALKGLIGGQARERIRYPKGRNINIPYPAVTLSDGKSSAFMPPPGDVVYVFDNDTGNILKSCVAPAPVTITSLTRSGSTVAALAPGHGFSSGNKIRIAGSSAPGFDGTFVLTAAVPGDGTFSYVMSAPLPAATASTGGSASLVVELVEGLDLSASGLSCTDYTVNAFLLSGYVRFKTSGAAPSAANIANTTDATLDLLATGPLVIDTTATGASKGPAAQVCYAQRQKVVEASSLDPEDITSIVRTGGIVTLTTRRSHSFTPGLRIAVEFVPVAGSPETNFNNSFTVLTVPSATTLTYADAGPDASRSAGRVSLIQQITLPESTPAPPGYSGVESRFIAYSCVVTPVDDDGDSATPRAWWGELKLVPSGWTLGSTSATYRVCRFSGDYIVDTKTSNHEHPRYYRRVTGALDNQNFLVIKGNDNCPTDVDPDPLSGDFINTNTVVHQGGPGPAYSFKCTSSACSGAARVVTEPEDAVSVIPMF